METTVRSIPCPLAIGLRLLNSERKAMVATLLRDYLDLSQLKVLVVEDNKHMQTIVRTLLRAIGFVDISVADNGEEALALLEASPADFVICDWVMSPVDGLEFTRRIRRGVGKIDSTVPIIMLTAQTEFDHVIEARDAGITEFLAKPVSANSLLHRILAIIDHTRPFVVAQGYVGPDRRRRDESLDGPDRRDKQTEGPPTAAGAEAATEPVAVAADG